MKLGLVTTSQKIPINLFKTFSLHSGSIEQVKIVKNVHKPNLVILMVMYGF